MKTVVIGAGVVGTSIALGLARRGVQVTLLERSWPGAGTSSTSYAWVNANGKEPESYYELNLAGLEAHHALADDGAPWLHPTGHLEFATDAAHAGHLRGRMQRLAERGYAVEELDSARARDLEPDVLVPDDAALVAFFPREAHVLPSQYLAHALARARAAGVELRTEADVIGLEPSGEGARVTLADGTVLDADTVVSAVGRWTPQVTALAGAPVPMAEFTSPGDVTVGYLMETNPLPVRLQRLVTSPWLNLRPDGGGRLLLQALDLDATADPGDVPAVDSEVAVEMLRRLRAVTRNSGAAVVRHLVVGQRVMPADGYTVVGRVPGADWLYAVATHSGVTLAPMLGERVAQEVLGADEALFSDFRPSRFAAGARVAPPSSPRKPGQQ